MSGIHADRAYQGWGHHKPLWSPARDAKLRELWPDHSIKVAAVRDAINALDTETCRPVSHINVSERRANLGVTPRKVHWRVRRRLELNGLMPPSAPERGSHRSIGLELDGGRGERYLQQEAAARGLGVAGLVRRLFRIICDDRMVNAILDDGDEVAKRQAQDALQRAAGGQQ